MITALEGQNVVVLDLETAKSAEDCRHCGQSEATHHQSVWADACPDQGMTATPLLYTKIGWEDKQALGLSIGCYFDYTDDLYHWFDSYTLEATIRLFVLRQSLLVSFNGIGFDFPLMRNLLRQEAAVNQFPKLEGIGRANAEYIYAGELQALCDQFKALCTTSYDLLHEIWQVDPVRKFERGLNSLGAISVANGFGAKKMDGAKAPQLWRQGRHAEVLNYNMSDVLKTKQLFEQIVTKGQILRGDGLPILLPLPHVS